MLRAHRHFAQFRGQSEGELLAWLREILITSLARFVEQHLLAAKRDLRREVSLDRFPGQLAGSSSGMRPLGRPVERTQSAEFPRAGDSEPSDLLADLLARLPEHYRQVLVLRNIQGFSFEEVATRLGRSPGATRMLWLRAIEKLRAIYRKAEQHDP
jgi:RNA polymerase sigma-70 factor (ECF subfamily)